MSDIWDDDNVSEYELLADDASEAERIAEEYSQAPEIVEASEEEIEELTEEAAFDLDNEESNVVYNARLRLEQARLYEMLVNHNLFEGVEADPRAVDIVQNELKHFIVKRLEILMGLRQPVIEKAKEITEIDLPFNDVEVDFLKQLAYKGTLGKSAQGESVQAKPVQNTEKPKGINPLSSKPKKSSLKTIQNTKPKKSKKKVEEKSDEAESTAKTNLKAKKNTPKKKKQPTATKQKKKQPMATKQKRRQAKQQKKAQPTKKKTVNSSGVMGERKLKKNEIEALARQELEEEKKKPKKDWTEMTTKEKMQRIKEVNKKYARPKPKDTLPMPTDRELELKYQQREMNQASRGGKNQFNSTLANIMLKRKQNNEEGE